MNYKQYRGHNDPEWMVKCQTEYDVWVEVSDTTLEKAISFYNERGKVGIAPLIYAKDKHGDYTKFEVHRRLNA